MEKTAEELAAEKKKLEEEAAAAEAEKAEKAKKAKKFTPEQTQFINDLFSNAFKEGAEKVESEMKAKLDEERKQREQLAKELEEIKKAAEKKVEPPKEDPKLAAFEAQVKEMQDILNGIKTERDALKQRVDGAEADRKKTKKKDAFLQATSDAKVTFFDPLEAYKLAEDLGYDWDQEQDRPVVLNKETKRPKLNENGEPMSVIDFVKDFAERKKYLVKADQQDGGTGGGSERRMERKEEPAIPDAEKMTPAEFDAFIQEVMNKPR